MNKTNLFSTLSILSALFFWGVWGMWENSYFSSYESFKWYLLIPETVLLEAVYVACLCVPLVFLSIAGFFALKDENEHTLLKYVTYFYIGLVIIMALLYMFGFLRFHVNHSSFPTTF